MNAAMGGFAALLILLGIQTWRLHSAVNELAEQKAAIATARADAEKEAREREQQMAEGARKASDAYSRNAQKLRGDADGARSELERLRDSLAASQTPVDTIAASRADDATRARFVVGKLAEAAATATAAADQCEAKLAGLQEWARAVVQPIK